MLRDKKQCNLYRSYNHVRTKKSGTHWWVCHVANVTGKEYVHNILGGGGDWETYTEGASSEIRG